MVRANLRLGIEESILLFLIAIELLDLFRIIPGELEFIEKTIAIIAILYLTYRISLSSILTASKYRLLDVLVTAGFFFLGLRSAMGFIISASLEQSSFQQFYGLVISNISFIEKFAFFAGISILIIASALLSARPIGKRCFLSIIHEHGPADSWLRRISRFFTVYISLLAFFLLVYTFIVEWLATTVDAPILTLSVVILLMSLVKHKKRMKTESFLLKATEAAESFYERFLTLFHSRKKIGIAIVGLLVLHLLVEIGHFLIPYATGLGVPWYFAQLGPGHDPLVVPLLQDLALAPGVFDHIAIILIYLFSLVAALVLFASPAYLWYHIYAGKRIRPRFIWLFYGLLTIFLLNPIFKMQTIKSALLIGTDIVTQQIPFLHNIYWSLFAALMVTAIFYLLGKSYLRRTVLLAFFISLAYFGYYLYFFFVDVWNYYVAAITAMTGSDMIIALHLLIFFALQMLFYLGGFLLLVYEVYTKEKI